MSPSIDLQIFRPVRLGRFSYRSTDSGAIDISLSIRCMICRMSSAARRSLSCLGANSQKIRPMKFPSSASVMPFIIDASFHLTRAVPIIFEDVVK